MRHEVTGAGNRLYSGLFCRGAVEFLSSSKTRLLDSLGVENGGTVHTVNMGKELQDDGPPLLSEHAGNSVTKPQLNSKIQISYALFIEISIEVDPEFLLV